MRKKSPKKIQAIDKLDIENDMPNIKIHVQVMNMAPDAFGSAHTVSLPFDRGFTREELVAAIKGLENAIDEIQSIIETFDEQGVWDEEEDGEEDEN